jgi:hypothetical protein
VDGRRYGAFVRAYAARFGSALPLDARTLLRDAGVVNNEVVNLTRDVEAARLRHRKTEERRLRRSLNHARRCLRIYLRELDDKVSAPCADREWGALLGRRTNG